jgi:hypothetical protein
MQTLERAAQIGEIAARIPDIQAQTQLRQAQSQEALMKVKREQQMLQLMAQGPQTDGNGKTLSQQMLSRAADLFHAGFVNEAMKVYNGVSEAQARDDNATSNALRAQVTLINQKDKQLNDMQNFFAGATDAGSFNILKSMWETEHPDVPIPPQLQRYDPAVIQSLQMNTKTGVERARLMIARAREETDAAYKRARLGQIASQEAATNGFRAWQKNFEEMKWRDRKAEGLRAPKVAGKADNKDLLRAQDLVKQDFPDIDPSIPVGKDEMVSSAAYDIANEARALVTRNPAITVDQAMQQVYNRMKQNGQLRKEHKAGMTLFGKEFGGEEKSVYKPSSMEEPPQQQSSKAATPLPPKGQPLVDGQYYTLPSGKTVKWNAKKGKGEVVNGD